MGVATPLEWWFSRLEPRSDVSRCGASVYDDEAAPRET